MLLLCFYSNGYLFPCRRLPVYVGDVFQPLLSELYRNDILELSRCLAHVVNGDMFSRDSGCAVRGIGAQLSATCEACEACEYEFFMGKCSVKLS